MYNVFNKTKERKMLYKVYRYYEQNDDLELIFQGSPMSTLKFVKKNKFDFVFRVENGDEINITRLFKY